MIALMCVFAIIVLPKLVFLISPDTPIYVYTDAISVVQRYLQVVVK